MSSVSDGLSGRVANGLQACGLASKVNDIGASLDSVRNTIADSKKSFGAKTAKCTAETAFIVARTAEITQKATDYRVKAVLNGLATTADVGRKIVDACIHPQPNSTTLKKVGFSIVTGATEAATNLALASNQTGLAIIGTTVSIVLTLARVFKFIKF